MSRVLVVDDDPDIRIVVRATLEADGHEVVGEAGDGHEAVALIPVVRPDAVVLDVMMPRLNGLDALVLIRQACPDTRVVMLTALGCDEVGPVAIGRGAVGCVEKPRLARDLPRYLSR